MSRIVLNTICRKCLYISLIIKDLLTPAMGKVRFLGIKKPHFEMLTSI